MQENTPQATVQETAAEDAARLISHLELPYLIALQGTLAKHIKERQEAGIAEAREKIRKIAADAGLTYDQLVNLEEVMTPVRKSREPLPAKFRNPDAPNVTWTGVGRQPRWVRDWLTAGKHLLDLAIKP